MVLNGKMEYYLPKYLKTMIKPIDEKTSGKLEIDLTGAEGNVFYLMGVARGLAKKLNELRGNEYLDSKEIINDMMSDDYEHAIEVMEKHFGHLIIMYR